MMFINKLLIALSLFFELDKELCHNFEMRFDFFITKKGFIEEELFCNFHIILRMFLIFHLKTQSEQLIIKTTIKP